MSYHLIAFTDFNPDVELKSLFGWFMVFTSFANFCYPNLYLVCIGMWPDIKNAYFVEEVPEDPKKVLAREFFEEKRVKLIRRYKLKLKEVEKEEIVIEPPKKRN